MAKRTTMQRLWDLWLDGGADREYGSTDEAPGRWWGLLVKTGVRGASNVIITQDSQGFLDYEAFPTALAASKAFERIVREVEAEMAEERYGREKDPYPTTFHRDGSVTLWNVYDQGWQRTSRPSDALLATLGIKERERVIKHVGRYGRRHHEGPPCYGRCRRS